MFKRDHILAVVSDVIKFWFLQAPVALARYFGSLNTAVLKFLSLGILTRTFFRPWKNEYREGLVGFSVGMGMFIKSFFIAFDCALLAVMVSLEVIFVILFLVWPFATIVVIFI